MSTLQTKVKERPIIFSGDSVKAILAGTKTQTRRVVKPQPPEGFDRVFSFPLSTETAWYKDDTREKWPKPNTEIWKVCPLGIPGDQLWVRETFSYRLLGGAVVYRATEETQHLESVWSTPIFMPRWASRLQLEITNVRVERLQEITAAYARAEGVFAGDYANQWDKINGKRDGCKWDDNPFVWVIEFKRVEAA